MPLVALSAASQLHVPTAPPGDVTRRHLTLCSDAALDAAPHVRHAGADAVVALAQAAGIITQRPRRARHDLQDALRAPVGRLRPRGVADIAALDLRQLQGAIDPFRAKFVTRDALNPVGNASLV